MDEFELMVAPTGARHGKAQHSALPISLEEIVDAGQSCALAGATSLHLHVRDAEGQHSLNPHLYNRTIEAVKMKTKLHVQVSTEAANRFDADAQLACLSQVAASDASVALREVRGRRDVYAAAAARGLDIQHILYSPEDVSELLSSFEAGTIPVGKGRVIFVLGRYTQNMTPLPADLRPFLDTMGDAPLDWMVCAFGPHEQACLLAALDHGGSVRVGFENNFNAPDGVSFSNNAEAVASLVSAARDRGFAPRREAA